MRLRILEAERTGDLPDVAFGDGCSPGYLNLSDAARDFTCAGCLDAPHFMAAGSTVAFASRFAPGYLSIQASTFRRGRVVAMKAGA